VPPPLRGAWAPDDRRLDDVEVFPLPAGVGPEDVAVDPDGGVVTGAEDGRIWRWPAGARPGDAPALVADTGGRPLGVEVDPRDGSLLVCDAWRGLLRVTADGAVTDLTDAAAGRPFSFCNNATVARDGTVYLTDSSDRYTVHTWKRDLLEHRPNGRVVAWSPSSGRTEVVADGLLFPNGLALTPDESALVVAEMGRYRVVRIALAGGDPVVLADLPAYPDNLSAVGDGTYWVALPSPRVAIAERLLPYPRLRQVVALLPDRLQPRPLRYGLAALLDAEGRVLRTLHGPAGRYAMVTGVRQQGGILWLGSLTERGIARTSL
jgi:sugar lactone lactonase YvrE